MRISYYFLRDILASKQSQAIILATLFFQHENIHFYGIYY